MAVITTNLTCELQEAVKIQYLKGNLFSQDVQANKISVAVYDGGSPASISGTVTANIIREDGGTVTATGGTISGNVVSITLPAAAYIVPGLVSIVIKVTASSVTTTIAAVVVNVYQSSTETAIDPGTIIPSVTALVAQIEAAVASIPADYSSLWASLAPTFDPSKTGGYKPGEYVTYNGKLYICTAAHTGSWNASHFAITNVGGELTSLNSETKTNTERVTIALFGGEYSPTFKNISYARTLIDGNYYIEETPYSSWGGIGTDCPLMVSDGDSISVDSGYIIKTGYIVTMDRNGAKQVTALQDIVDTNQYNFKTGGLYLIAIRKWNDGHTAFVDFDASELSNAVHITANSTTKELANNEAYTDSRLVAASYGGVYHPRFINGSYARVETGSDYLTVLDSTNYCVTSLEMPLIASGGDVIDVDSAYILTIGYRIIKDGTGVKIAEGLQDIANTNHYVFKSDGLYLIGVRKPNPGGSGYLDFDNIELDRKISINANPITNRVKSLAQYTDKRLVASIDGGVYDALFANGMVARVATGSVYVELVPNSTYCSNDPNYPLIISKGDTIDIDSNYKITVCNKVENDEIGTKIVGQVSDIVGQSHYVFKETGLYLLLIRKPTGESTYGDIDATELIGKVKITTNGASSKANNVDRPLNPYENLYWGGTQYITSCHAHCLTTIEGLIEAGYTALIPTNYRPPKPYYPPKYFYPDVPGIADYLAAPNTEIAANITATKAAHFCNPGSMLAVGTDSSATYNGTLDDLINDCRNTRKGFRVGGVIVNHPSWSGLTAADMIPALQSYSDIIGIEFYNYGCELSDGTGWALTQWDAILSAGIQCFGFAAPDHALETASGQTNRPTGFIHVLPACPTDDALLMAIGNGRFYASLYNDGLAFTSIKKTTTKIQVSASATTSSNPSIKFITATRNSTVSGLTGEFTFAATDIYVRVEVTNGNNKLYSNAIFI